MIASPGQEMVWKEAKKSRRQGKHHWQVLVSCVWQELEVFIFPFVSHRSSEEGVCCVSNVIDSPIQGIPSTLAFAAPNKVKAVYIPLSQGWNVHWTTKQKKWQKASLCACLCYNYNCPLLYKNPKLVCLITFYCILYQACSLTHSQIWTPDSRSIRLQVKLLQYKLKTI